MSSRLEIVKFLHENRTEGCTSRAINEGSRYAKSEVIEYLLDKGYPCDLKALDGACKFNKPENMRVLWKHRRDAFIEEIKNT